MKKLYTLITFSVLCIGAASATQFPVKLAQRAGFSSTKPVTKPATNVTPSGFTANWQATPGASLYQVTCYEPITVPQDGTYSVLSEDFSYVQIGTFQSPEMLDDMFVDLDDYNMVQSPDWQGYLPVFARGMVGGIVYSPYIDLTNDGGKYTVNLTVTGWQGGRVTLESHGSTTEKVTLDLSETGANEFAVPFTNGTHDTFFVFVDYGIVNDPDGSYTNCFDFLDDIEFIQDLKKDDTVLRLIQHVETAEDSGVTSWDFKDMKFLNGAKHVAYDVMAINVYYPDLDDPYDYETEYSEYSDLEHVYLNSGVEDVEIDGNAPATFYNLQGVEMKGELAPGLYIRRQGNKTEKVVIR